MDYSNEVCGLPQQPKLQQSTVKDSRPAATFLQHCELKHIKYDEREPAAAKRGLFVKRPLASHTRTTATGDSQRVAPNAVRNSRSRVATPLVETHQT